jgi:hypothetical protein
LGGSYEEVPGTKDDAVLFGMDILLAVFLLARDPPLLP